ncbi:MAG: tripartite tricarboxylate transporter permease [Candidatus Pacearchaeota archaeon]|nr:tripartite tricarboxylate transporter permease [Candidatus Pacearchaeota archaeon]
MLQILFAIFFGILAGIFTGLVPGVHINLVALILFILSPYFSNFTSPLVLACFIVAMAITHCFIDFIPSIFLGAPKEETALSVLPGHRMLLKGKGYEAIKLTTIGCLLGTLVACPFAIFFIFTASFFYYYLYKGIPFILLGISLLLIIKENKKIEAFFIFLFSGVFGFLTLNFTLIKQALFPLFTSLFGSPLLLISFLQNVSIPKQKIRKVKIQKKDILTGIWSSILSSSLVSFLPGVGAAQAASISASLKKMSSKVFLFVLGMISTMTMLFSFVALYAIQKPRTGVAVFVGKFLPGLSEKEIILFMVVAVLTSFVCFFIASFFARIFSKNITKIKYKWICLGILIFLLILTPIVSGLASLLVFFVGTCLGIMASMFGIRKIHLMGSLILPVIIWYLS